MYSGYKELMKSYVGVKGPSSSKDKLFACPADVFYPSFILSNATMPFYVQKSLHEYPLFDYSSFAFNGGDNITRILGTNRVVVDAPGLTGIKLSSVRKPARSILVTEASAIAPWSWHAPVWPDLRTEALTYNNARNEVTFVDGHVSYIKIYWNEAVWRAKGPSFSMSYNPPDGYEYQWSPD
jgi:hypothetical protein